ncbi:MAG: VOC family protein [Spirochaetaceae bacterium]|nr:VOC family protein [Spirochaetaceae bacterium]
MTNRGKAAPWHISQVALNVGDLDAAVAFYRNTLGIPFIARATPGLAFFDCDGVRLMLTANAGAGTAGCALYFKVPDIERRYGELQGCGVTFDGPPQVMHAADDYELRMAFFRDPAGNLLAIMAENGVYERQG